MNLDIRNLLAGAHLLPPPKPGARITRPARSVQAPTEKEAAYRMSAIDGSSLYELVREAAASGPTASAIQTALAAVPELAAVVVVQSFADLPLSTRIRAGRDGVTPDGLCGVFSSGVTYVVADRHESVADALRTAVHEEVGHRGIRGFFSNRLDPEMERLYHSQALTLKGVQRIAQIREAYAPVLATLDERGQRLMVAEEMVAHLIDSGEKPTALQRLAAKARRLLRNMLPQVRWTYGDILELGEQSRKWLKNRSVPLKDQNATVGAPSSRCRAGAG